jgi:tetratricopeptide (TPR) repeat protein
MTRWLPILATLALVGRAHADKVDPARQARADVLFEKAQADYQANHFQAAIELFKLAYEEIPDPVYLFNIAQSYRKVLDCEAASDYYKRYLAALPDADNKAKVEGWLRELSPCVEQRKQEHDDARRGQEAEKARLADEARRKQAAAAHAQPTEIDHGRTFRIAGIATGAVGALGLVIGITYSIKGGNIKQDIANQCTGMATCTWDMGVAGGSSPAQLDADGKHANTMAAVGYIGGGIAAAAGVALYMYGRARVEHVAITPAEGGATVSALLRF